MALTDKLTNIADAIRGKTGGTEGLTLDQMATEIAGIETGGGFPQKFYETDFILEDNSVSGVVCTISTGLSVNYVAGQNEIVFAVITNDLATGLEKRMTQPLTPSYGTGVNCNDCLIFTSRTYMRTAGVHISNANADMSGLTISLDINQYVPITGIYHLELYRTGFVA